MDAEPQSDRDAQPHFRLSAAPDAYGGLAPLVAAHEPLPRTREQSFRLERRIGMLELARGEWPESGASWTWTVGSCLLRGRLRSLQSGISNGRNGMGNPFGMDRTIQLGPHVASFGA